MYLIPKILIIFTKTYEISPLQIQIDSTKILLNNLIHKKIDIAIIQNKISNKLKKKIIIKNLIKDEFILIISKFYSLNFKSAIFRKKNYSINIIALNSNSTLQKLINNKLNQNKITFKQFQIVIILNSIKKIKIAVILGLGAAFIPLSAIRNKTELRKIKILQIDNIEITKKLLIITNSKQVNLENIKLFYNKLGKLKKKS